MGCTIIKPVQWSLESGVSITVDGIQWLRTREARPVDRPVVDKPSVKKIIVLSWMRLFYTRDDELYTGLLRPAPREICKSTRE